MHVVEVNLNPKTTMNDTPEYTVPTAPSPAHEILSSRVIPFPRPRVFAAWTHPELHAQWWGPAGFANTFYNYDVRPGGNWRFTMQGPDGTNYENHCVFDHVAEGTCIVLRHLSQPEFTIVAHFTDEGDGTRLEWHMIFATAESCAAVATYAAGKNEENLDRLEALLGHTPEDAVPLRELTLWREIDAPVDVVWRVLTTRVQEWWCPKPWSTPVVEWDLRAGGRCHTIMRGPAGEEHDMEGVFLEVVANQRLVFTDAYQSGWAPTTKPFMTGIFELVSTADGKTNYRASSRHWTAEAHDQHAAMGFRTGWGLVADQLIAVVVDEMKRKSNA